MEPKNNTMVQLITDYVENVTRHKIKKIIHLEDLVETSPTDPNKTDCVYQLFDVQYESGLNEKYMITTSASANVVIPVTEQILTDLFPSYLEKALEKDQDEV